jgi:hypothetical protein
MSTDFDSLAMLAKERHADMLAAAMQRQQTREQQKAEAAAPSAHATSPWRRLQGLFGGSRPQARPVDQPLDPSPARS